MTQSELLSDAIALLKDLIATPSISREEDAAAQVFENQLKAYGLKYERKGNNIWCLSPKWEEGKPTLLLNAHIDTVKPVASWTRNPFEPTLEDDILYGLGSNDCGGGLVTLLQVYRYFQEHESPYNLIYLASAEEEVSGANGISCVLPLLPKIDVAIVGEPTNMQPAVAEKGLMVIDMTSHGKSGHAARNEGVNAIYEMLDDLTWIRNYQFKKESEFLGATKMTVTMINAGTQHNVIPDECKAVIDVRTNEYYQNEFLFEFLRKHLHSDVKARSFRLHSSHIDINHPLIQKCISMGKKPFGSPTLSDQALMPFPSFKMGPGESSRSHSANEFIRISEMQRAIEEYIQLIGLSS